MMEYALGGGITLLLAMSGAIWAKVGKLEDKFDDFRDDCRDRHEEVMTKDDYRLAHDPLVEEISTIRSRIDRCEACKEVADRR